MALRCFSCQKKKLSLLVSKLLSLSVCMYVCLSAEVDAFNLFWIAIAPLLIAFLAEGKMSGPRYCPLGEYVYSMGMWGALRTCTCQRLNTMVQKRVMQCSNQVERCFCLHRSLPGWEIERTERDCDPSAVQFKRKKKVVFCRELICTFFSLLVSWLTGAEERPRAERHEAPSFLWFASAGWETRNEEKVPRADNEVEKK